jgi:hypothetical protein
MGGLMSESRLVTALTSRYGIHGDLLATFLRCMGSIPLSGKTPFSATGYRLYNTPRQNQRLGGAPLNG